MPRWYSPTEGLVLAELEAKIERSKEQIDYLESEFTAFVEANSTGVTREEDPQTGEWVFRFQMFRDVPLRLSVIVGEVLHDLRSSLDQITCHLIQRNGVRLRGTAVFLLPGMRRISNPCC
jgi:hypothetical protein